MKSDKKLMDELMQDESYAKIIKSFRNKKNMKFYISRDDEDFWSLSNQSYKTNKNFNNNTYFTNSYKLKH